MTIASEMENNGIKVCYPEDNLTSGDLLGFHRKCLSSCKGVMIYNSGNINWFLRKLNDIKKAPGWGRTSPVNHKYYCGQKIIKEEILEIEDYVFVEKISKQIFDKT